MSTNKVVECKDGKWSMTGMWMPPQIDNVDDIPKGDMPGDSIQIDENHIKKTNTLFPKLLEQLIETLNASKEGKAVISIHGGSGVGKSETGSLVSYYLNELGIGSYVLSGDNYPRRIPKYNDAERYRIFRASGLKAVVEAGLYNESVKQTLAELKETDQDANPDQASTYPWLETYQKEGIAALNKYLGTDTEIDFAQLNGIIDNFKTGQTSLWLKRMGREDNDLWYDAIDVSKLKVIVIEWTHGNNKNLVGVDIPVLLNSTPEETMEHRRKRNRDKGVDSPFTTMILRIEQGLLHAQAHKAKFIILKSGELVEYDEYLKLMNL